MTIEQSHGRPRITRPRPSDVHGATGRAPTRQRDRKGHFEAGNTLASGRTWKAALRALLPTGADEQAAQRLYAAACRELEHDNVFARAEALRFVAHTITASQLRVEVSKAGLGTALGLKLTAAANAADDLAAKSAIAALAFTKRSSPSTKATTTLDAARARIRGGEAP